MIKNITIGLLILGILILGGYYYFNPNVIVEECEPIEYIEPNWVSSLFDTWAENAENSKEVLFRYWVYNYGDEEVKNLKIRCKVWDRNGNLILSEVDNFGNLASQSVYYDEYITDGLTTNSTPTTLIPEYEYEEQTGICYVESCDNCEILWKKIPEIREEYEETNM